MNLRFAPNASEDFFFLLDPSGKGYEFWLAEAREMKARDRELGAAESCAASNAKAAARRRAIASGEFASAGSR